MIIDAKQTFSNAQRLPANGDAVSQRVDALSFGGLDRVERPSLHIQTINAAPRSDGFSLLEVGLLHSDDGNRFEWAFSPVEKLEIARMKPWALTPTRLPAGLKRFLMLRYRVTGDRLATGAMTAFLSEEETEKPWAAQRHNKGSHPEYSPLGYHFPAGYNQPSKW